ncbi:hypothetical protein RJZ56_004676 [Blastomyces dermatitidis]|uniref:Uncharacterized protein n=2 Tax=Ajellomyces dermatitidis TaxID=5039 RepID=F2T8L7_AJEDA|nr:uncharacterized protein BDCG_03138 [Blastomyces dermatitidis ER-3]EEQ88018.2 hypothetical protein BDCG_03138 [Blastomyces dermatitidis ER-3]EGE79580.1 hypothetical protein BDDG_02521 [Blastomyces dermatitidis ATCC 18188]EQL32572.1 hypothetical protein BDFG_05303 [Blastomyces dermatitidis ATCC 26199]
MSMLSSQWVDSQSSPVSPSSYHQVREDPSNMPVEADSLEYEVDMIAEQQFPQVETSDDGTYVTEDSDISQPDSNSNAQEEDQPTMEGDDYDSSGDSPIPERPNRYLGPPSTWRAKTRQERNEISSLEALRARDLSVHLFNAFALKRRAIAIKAQKPEQDQKQRSNDEEDEWLSSKFMPTKQWTAWPLHADEVPRGDSHVLKDDSDIWNVAGPSDGRPSAELEECLMAQMLKTAKERFEARAWDNRRPRARQRSKGMASTTDTGGAISTGMEESDDDVGIHAEPQLRPVVQADDDKSRSILRPTARHILSDFDNILMSLHHARQAYVSTIDLSQSEHETEAQEELTSRPVSRSRAVSLSSMSGSRRIKRSRHLSLSRDPPATSDHEGNIELSDASNRKSRVSNRQRTRSGTPRRSRSRSPGSRESKLGLRDWSDIVGIASISGWPASVVMRTAKRCSELFKEDMAFRKLNEGQLELNEGNENRLPTWDYVEEEGSGESRSDFEIHNITSRSRKRGQGYGWEINCPVKGCSRSTKGFSRTWNLNQHIKNKHPSLALKGRPSKSAPLTKESK